MAEVEIEQNRNNHEGWNGRREGQGESKGIGAGRRVEPLAWLVWLSS